MLSSMAFGPPHDLETDSKSFSISGAQCVNGLLQKLYLGFCFNCSSIISHHIHTQIYRTFGGSFTLINSMKVISNPHGWGRLTMRRSNNTRVICSWIMSCAQKPVCKLRSYMNGLIYPQKFKRKLWLILWNAKLLVKGISNVSRSRYK